MSSQYSRMTSSENHEKENIDPGRNLFKQYQDSYEVNNENLKGKTTSVDDFVQVDSCENKTMPKVLDEEYTENVSSGCEHDVPNKQGSLTPKGTPIKNLPFSPSQVNHIR